VDFDARLAVDPDSSADWSTRFNGPADELKDSAISSNGVRTDGRGVGPKWLLVRVAPMTISVTPARSHD